MKHKPPGRRSQPGSTLVVVLVILIAMTFLGLSGMSDSNLLLAMVRNSQFQTGVYTVALTEINAQLDRINTNAEAEDDQIILNLIQTRVGNNDTSRSNDLSNDLLTDDILGADTAGHYTRTLTLTEPNTDTYLPVSGMSLSPDSTVKWLVMELNSEAAMTDARSSSNQIQGFKYLAAN